MAWLGSFLAQLLSPLIEKLAISLLAKMQDAQQAKLTDLVNKAEQDANAAKTDEERIKAAREMAEANRQL